jgi:hypothetical protein
LRQLGRLPRLEQCRQKRLIAFHEPRLTRRSRELAQARVETLPVVRFSLQTLHELQTTHQAQPLGFNLRRARASSILGIETPDPGLMKLRRFAEEPLGRQRLTVVRLHWSLRTR